MKHILKKLLVPVLANRHVSDLASQLLVYGVPIFMLHRISADDTSKHGHTPAYLRRCLHFLKSNHHSFVSLEDILAAIRGETMLPRKPVAFTMDDGFLDQASLAAPVFIEFGCPVTIFLISGMLDGTLWPWDDQVAYLINHSIVDNLELSFEDKKLSFKLTSKADKRHAIRAVQHHMKLIDGDAIPSLLETLAESVQLRLPSTPPQEFKPMSWDLARELEQKGIRFAPHTVSHRILSRLNNQSSEREILESWQRLNSELAAPSSIFCYPTGRTSDFGTREIRVLEKLGFHGAVSTVPDYVRLKNGSQNQLFQLPRFALPEVFDDFLQYCTWIEYAKSTLLRFRK